jgi:hypothetical protein
MLAQYNTALNLAIVFVRANERKEVPLRPIILFPPFQLFLVPLVDFPASIPFPHLL